MIIYNNYRGVKCLRKKYGVLHKKYGAARLIMRRRNFYLSGIPGNISPPSIFIMSPVI